MLYHYIDNNFCKAWGIDGDLDWYVINHFCEPIDDDEDWIIAIAFPICQNW